MVYIEGKLRRLVEVQQTFTLHLADANADDRRRRTGRDDGEVRSLRAEMNIAHHEGALTSRAAAARNCAT